MNSSSIIVAAAFLLLGCMVLRGINPIDRAVEAVIWTLYRLAAVTAAIARTTDAAYLRLKREYCTSVNNFVAERAAMLRAEEISAANTTARAEAQGMKLVVN